MKTLLLRIPQFDWLTLFADPLCCARYGHASTWTNSRDSFTTALSKMTKQVIKLPIVAFFEIICSKNVLKHF